MKTCRLCGISKPLDEFHRASNAPDGRQYRCKQCAIAAARQWAKDHPDAAKAADKRYREKPETRARQAELRQARADRIREQKRASYQRHKDRINAEAKAKREADPDRFREYRRREYKRNRETILARNRAWQHANLDRLRVYRRLRTYGVDGATVEAMFAEQRGHCAICSVDLALPGETVNGSQRTAVCLDHDHVTGRVRGLLCTHCNKGLGQFGDDPDRLRAAARYLTKHKT